ncbi:MAG: alpha/beta hydrolase, partial [Solirubrobacterales bacterium]|nr:alpha/beta hydrolase [Solirubrobacterales bacterium]
MIPGPPRGRAPPPALLQSGRSPCTFAFMGHGGVLLAALLLALLLPAGARAEFDPAYEARNFSKTTERFRLVTGTVAYQALLREKGALRELQAVQVQAGDPERRFVGQLCWQKMDGCSGEVRAYDWSTRGAGLATPVSWVARNGSVISGHVWATPDGPAKRPGAVLTTGSVQAPEELYWTAAQALAKAGYVVLSWDVQGQGLSDTFGEGGDRMDGVPSQGGQPFYDGTEDALDFFFSAAGTPYAPRRSCSSGTDHAPKQARRVQEGRASAHNPFAQLLDPGRVGIFGHSLGAGAVSYVGQLDPRVKAIVAYDNLGASAPDATAAPFACASGSSPRPPVLPLTKPAIGIANDYGLLPQPNTSDPAPDAKSVASRRLSAAGTDTMEVVIRGGTHYESSVIPNPAFGGSLRGNDLAVFYTVAWFDRYVKGDAGAVGRLLTERFRSDAAGGAIDPDGDPNDFSRYHRSRLDIAGTDGRRIVCEDLRAGCPALAAEGDPKPYDAIAVVQATGPAEGPGLRALRSTCATNTTDPVGATGAPPAATRQTPPCVRPPGSIDDTPAPGSVAAC